MTHYLIGASMLYWVVAVLLGSAIIAHRRMSEGVIGVLDGAAVGLLWPAAFFVLARREFLP